MTKNIFSKLISVVLVLVMLMSLAACGSANGSEADAKQSDNSGKIKVVATIFPEYDWVREIAGASNDNIELTLLLDNGVDLHSFQPTAADIATISTCDMFIYVGGESDAWVDDALKEATNKNMIVLDLMDILGDSVKEEELVEGMQGEEEDHDEAEEEHHDDEDEEEHHDEEEGHHHDGEIEYDEHVWLSLRDAETICNSIADGLCSLDSENAETYKANCQAYTEKLAALDADYQDAVDNAKVDTLLFADRFPFRYMVEDYGLNYYAAFIGCSAETEASFETIIFLAGKVDELGLPAICTIDSSDGKIADTVKSNTKSKDQEILMMDSLQSVKKTDIEAGITYYDKMVANLEVLKKALGE